MRHNGRAPLKASKMRPEHLSLRENEPVLVVCRTATHGAVSRGR